MNQGGFTIVNRYIVQLMLPMRYVCSLLKKEKPKGYWTLIKFGYRQDKLKRVTGLASFGRVMPGGARQESMYQGAGGI